MLAKSASNSADFFIWSFPQLLGLRMGTQRSGIQVLLRHRHGSRYPRH
ncbi:hypothetical protein THF5H11_20699 [Vibrio jasicida]|nr:hypothetical protein THF5H11_20699 [Vibrio jasicida]